MAKGHAYDDLYARLETKEGEKELCRLVKQRDRAEKDVQHVRVIKDENGNVIVNSEAVLKRWKEYFEKLMNKENNREPRTEEAEVVDKEVNCVSREVKNALRRMKKGKAVVHGRNGDKVFDSSGNPVNVDYAHAVKKRDHHEFLGGLALSGLLGSGRSSMLPLGTLSLGLSVITIDPAFIAGYQSDRSTGY